MIRAFDCVDEEFEGGECLQLYPQAAWPTVRARLGFVSTAPGVSLGRDDIHIWWIDLERVETDSQAVLSAEERARAERIRHPRDRRWWTAARLALRQILARYSAGHPAEIRLTQGDGGKPALVNDSSLRFSLTHARERAAVAVSWEREVGIDLEPIDPGLDVSRLSTVVCSRSEAARIDALAPAARPETFLAYWTCKEAYLKGTGTGLSRDPRTVEIELPGDDWTAVRDSVAGVQEPLWRVRRLETGPGWIAALAISGQEPSLMVYRWSPQKITPVAEELGSAGKLAPSPLQTAG